MARVTAHHDGSALYVSDLAPEPGATVSVRVRVPRADDPAERVTGVHVRTVADGEQLFVDARVVDTDEHEAWWQAELVCHNPVTRYRFLLDGGAVGHRWLNGTGVHPRDVPDAADFRIVSHPPPPAWAADGQVVYQVFPDRFARDTSVEPADGAGGPRTDLPDWAAPAGWDEEVDLGHHTGSRQVYGGTLDGVREHLDHVADLGATVVYLTPVFPARSNHRYDASTFAAVDPVLGGDEALSRLRAAAHERGLRVMGDITTNHTGDAHEWFQAAAADPEGEPGRWYVRDPDVPGGFVTWLGVPSLPKLDHTHPPVRAAVCDGPNSVIRRWLGAGAGFDSWRVDVANMTGRYREVDVAHDVARAARRAVDEASGGQALLVAEHVHDHSGDVVGDGWHGVMNYSGFTKPVWTWLCDPAHPPAFLGSPARVPRVGGALVAETMREFSAIVSWRALTHSLTLLGSHDTTRVSTLLGGDRALGEVAAGLLLTLPGIPMITYGDEIGMEGRFGEAGRRPMPWSARGRGSPLWDEELLTTYRDLIRVRREHPALHAGGMQWLHAEDDALVYLREHPEQTALVHVARAGHPPVRVPVAGLSGAATGVAVYGVSPQVDGDDLVLAGDGPGVSVWVWVTAAPPWEVPR